METMTDWNRRGRQAYVTQPMRGSANLTRIEAERRVLLALGSEFLRVPMPQRDAAISDATQGFLELHRELGGTMV